jgi:hypothetical protein
MKKHHSWTKTQKKEIYRLSKQGVPYDQIASKYDVSVGAIAGQVHWYRKEIEKLKKARKRRREYEKKKLERMEQSAELAPITEGIVHNSEGQSVLFVPVKAKRGRPRKDVLTEQEKQNIVDLVVKLLESEPRYVSLLNLKNRQITDYSKAIQGKIETLHKLREKLYEVWNSPFVQEASTKDLYREIVYLDKEIEKNINNFNDDEYAIRLARMEKARASRKSKGGRKKKIIIEKKEKVALKTVKKEKTGIEGVGEKDILEMAKIIDQNEKKVRKSIEFLAHLSDMTWVQRANSKPLIDAMIEDLKN